MTDLAEDLGARLAAAVEGTGGDTDAAPAADTGSADIGAGDTGATDQTGNEAGGQARDASGRFAPKQAAQPGADGSQAAAGAEQAPAAQPGQQQTADGQQSAQPGQQAQDATQQGAAPVVPPATWSAGAKSEFAKLPEVVRREVAKREQDYARGIQQHAEKARGFDTIMEISRPYEAMLRAEGSDPAGALQSFLHQAYVLRTASPQQKGELVMQIAQKFGADLSQFYGQSAQQGQQQDGQQDPMQQMQQIVQQLLAPHLQKIERFEQGQLTAAQHAEQQQTHEIQSQIEAFQSATNPDGSLKHLYFENVRPAMSAFFASGLAKDLNEAYEMACHANPEVRAALQAEQQRTADAQRLEEARRKTAEAGAAGFHVNGQGGPGIAGAKSMSLEEELAGKLAAATGNARM